ncbi:MAG: AAA family ATPase [Acidobacteria bacterium]|nr:AAA family ATPase [Acidobacteriota bacterium]
MSTGLIRYRELVRAMRACPQDAVHHAEGDVWTHVAMVCRALPPAGDERELVYAAALLHDVAKPLCTRVEDDGRITARGHSARGALLARRLLWERGVPVEVREQICALVRFHQVPFYLIEREDAARTVRRMSQSLRCAHLATLARADALGRRCADQQELLTRIGLFEELCRELGCLDQAWPFADGLSRFEYFRREDRDPAYRAYDASKCEVVLMSGLPASGKDTWLREKGPPGLPVISLDALREEIEDRGQVIQAAKEQARVYLRAGTAFAWNATNLTRDLRGQLIDLFTDYYARTRIVHVEAASPALWWERNAARERPVPGPAMERMLERWDVPDVTEAAKVEWWRSGEDGSFVNETNLPGSRS